jgi:hypothetical protein
MLTVTDPVQAKALTDVEAIGFLQTLIGAEHTVAEAAALWNVRVDAAYYRVKTLERLGLVRVTRTSKRAGRAVKHYRAISDDFFVPLGIIPEATLEAFLETANLHFQRQMLEAQSKAIHRAFSSGAHRERWGIHIGRDTTGQLNVHLSDTHGNDPDMNDPDVPLIADGWPTLHLEPAEARLFRQELLTLFRRYEHYTGSRKYLFHFAFAPLED